MCKIYQRIFFVWIRYTKSFESAIVAPLPDPVARGVGKLSRQRVREAIPARSQAADRKPDQHALVAISQRR